MIKKLLFIELALILATGFLPAQERAENPIIKHMYTADPSAHVWDDGRLYLYPSTDVSPPQGCDLMDGYHVFSTADMINWTDHGEILHSRDVDWGRPEGGFMWAPDCAYRNGRYYFYFPHPSTSDWNNSWKIGIATSDNPSSGFEVQGYINGLDALIDPCVFIDDDDQAYFYQGGGQICKGGKLAGNMTEIDGSMQTMTGLTNFHEGAWVFKRNGTYYMIYPDNYDAEPVRGNQMLYAISENPLGPWIYKGVILDPTGCHTSHGSIVEYKDKWYLFYHNSALSGMDNLRSVCFDEVTFNEDGTINKVVQTLNATIGETWPVIHSEVHFQGEHAVLPVGAYALSDLESLGIADNSISSIKVLAGFRLDLYQDDHFQGTRWTMRADDSDLSDVNCNNEISSLIVAWDSSSTKIEAEDGSVYNGATIGSNNEASGGKMLENFHLAGSYVEMSGIDGGEGGHYYIDVVYASAEGAGLGFEVNAREAGWNTTRSTGGWTKFSGIMRHHITLRPGTDNVIKVLGGTYGINIDYIVLTPGDGSLFAGIKAVADAITISLYPNPADDRIYLNLPTHTNVDIEMFDLSGKRVLGFQGKGDVQIPIQDMASGLYFISAQIGKQRQIHRILILRIE